MAVCKNIVYGPTADEPDDNAVDPINNVIIPATGKPRLRIQAVYGDDGVQLIYYECTLSIDTIIYDQTTQTVGNMEAEAKRIYEILMTPGLKLRIYPLGLGEIEVINTVTRPDLKGGPYPQDCTVEPIAGSNAIALSWVVMFRINFCPTPQIPTLIQFNSEFDIDVDDEGDVVFNARYTYQSSQPIVNIGPISNLVDALQRNNGASFQGMKRRKRSSLSRDQRVLHIHVEYREIKSDSPFFINTRNIEFVDEISSDLFGKSLFSGSGFMSWNRKFVATISLPARIHKGYAWYVFLMIVKQRLSRLNQLNKLKAIIDTKAPDAQKDLLANEKNSYLLTSVKITNPVYTRQMRFELSYFIVTDLDNLIDKTKIFARVNSVFSDPPTNNTPLKLSDQWYVWDQATNVALNGSLAYTMNGPIVYNQCTGNYSSPRVAGTALGLMETDPDGTTPVPYESPYTQQTTEHTWLAYKNEFSIIEETNNIQANYLQPVTDSYYQSQEGDLTPVYRDGVGYKINAKYVDPAPSAQKPKTINRGTSSFKLRMRGYAIRVKHKIPIPVVVSVAGKAVSRTGVAQTSHKQISQGNPPVYLAAWDIVYNVDKDVHADDILNRILTSGDPGNFS